MNFHSTQLRFLLTLGVLLMSAGMASATIPGLCNTGLSNGSGVCTGPLVTADSGTTTDANWVIATPYPTAPSTSPIPNPCGAATQCNPALTYEPAWVDFPDPSWLANSVTFSATASEWITPQTELSLGGYYVYATTFPVPTSDGHVTIVGELLSDNEVDAIYLSSGTFECIAVDGYPYDNAAVNSPSNFVPPWTAFTITKAPVTPGGTATLYIVVRNRGVGGIDSNPTDTGLRVEFNQKSSVFSK